MDTLASAYVCVSSVVTRPSAPRQHAHMWGWRIKVTKHTHTHTHTHTPTHTHTHNDTHTKKKHHHTHPHTPTHTHTHRNTHTQNTLPGDRNSGPSDSSVYVGWCPAEDLFRSGERRVAREY